MNFKEIILKETGIDITKKCRRREYIEMKACTSYVMRKMGFQYTEIGKYMNLDHATIIHHIKIYDAMRFSSARVQDMEDILLGKSTTNSKEIKKLEEVIYNQKKMINNLQMQIATVENNNIKRLIPLLKNKDIEVKFNAFVELNEKAKFYPKFN